MNTNASEGESCQMWDNEDLEDDQLEEPLVSLGHTCLFLKNIIICYKLDLITILGYIYILCIFVGHFVLSCGWRGFKYSCQRNHNDGYMWRGVRSSYDGNMLTKRSFTTNSTWRWVHYDGWTCSWAHTKLA